jgi:hypothetical protein
MRRIKIVLAVALVAGGVARLGAASAPAPAPADDIVKMSPVKVHAGGFEEFVPSWVFGTKPPRLILQSAERVRAAATAVKWLIRPELGLRHGDEIVAVNGKRSDDPGFLALWASARVEGATLALEVRAEGAIRSRKIQYVVTTIQPAVAAPKKK